MTREQLWSQYAAAALSGMLANEYSQGNPQAMAVDAGTAGNYADAMLAEHMHRFPQDQQETRQPDADGWIKWYGGRCTLPAGTIVDVMYRDGRQNGRAIPVRIDGVLGNKRVGIGRWVHDGSGSDIIAYRISR